MDKIKNLVIAEDDPAILDGTSLMLEFAGYKVSASANGSSLLATETTVPALYLPGIWLCGVDGSDLCKQLKQKECTKRVPVVLFSASRHIERSAPEAGADYFLAKPFEMKDLPEKVKRYTSQ